MDRLLNPVQPLILASESPRRREILTNLGFSFEVFKRHSHEEPSDLKNPAEFVVNLAEQKSKEPREYYSKGFVLTADTIVYLDGTIIGKPKNQEDAFRMINRLQGNTHQVYTGLCMSDCSRSVQKSACEVTDVTFRRMTKEEIEWYITTEEFKDKAGAYAIQGKSALFISGIKGCFYNVVGLPVNLFYAMYRELLMLEKAE